MVVVGCGVVDLGAVVVVEVEVKVEVGTAASTVGAVVGGTVPLATGLELTLVVLVVPSGLEVELTTDTAELAVGLSGLGGLELDVELAVVTLRERVGSGELGLGTKYLGARLAYVGCTNLRLPPNTNGRR